MIRSFVDGVLAVLLAVVAGVLLAVGLAELGLTDTAWVRLGPWLAGAGLLGAWQQQVSATVAGGISWTTTVTGVPLLVTGVVAVFVTLRARRSQWLNALPAAAGSAGAAALLVLTSRWVVTTGNEAGSVTSTHGLTWFWTLNHPGTVVGAACLVGGVWLLQTVGARWWRSGRGVAWALLAGLGILLTAALAAGAWYLTSSTSVGLGLALLYPLAGTLALFGLAGAPVEVGLTRLTPQTMVINTWQEGLLYGVGGMIAALLLACLAGLLLRVAKHRSTWLGSVTTSAVLATFLAWAMNTRIAVPAGLGSDSVVWVNPLFAGAAAAGLSVVVRFIAGHPKPAADAPPADPSGQSDIESLLRDVQTGPGSAP